MTEQAVLDIVGRPDEIRKAPPAVPGYAFNVGPKNADMVFVYKGSGYATKTSRIFFFNGRVVAKGRSLD